MRIRTVLTLLALVLCAGASRADIFWYTDPGIPEIRSFDSTADALGAPITVPAPGTDPRVAVAYTGPTPAIWGLDSLSAGGSAGPIMAYVDDPFVVIVDILPGSPTFNSVIGTIDLRRSGETSVGCQFLKFHPSGTRIYVSCVGSATSVPSVRIIRQVIGLPASSVLYSFDPTTNPGDYLSAELSEEWETMTSPPLSGPAIIPYGIDVAPDNTKVYFASHFETGGVNVSNVHGFTIDVSGDYVANITVTELPGADFDHCYYLRFSPSTLAYDSGGSRCYVSNNYIPDLPGAPPPPSPGFVMVINTLADATTLPVEAGILPPNTAGPLVATTPAFDAPIGIDWATFITEAFVADQDGAFAPPLDGIIGVRVFSSITPPGMPPAADISNLYFADPTPTDDTTPVHCGVAVDNDDAEVVFCDFIGMAIDHYDTSGVLVARVPTTPLGSPAWIVCQSGTGAGGSGGGGGGSGGGSGGTPYNDNGAPIGQYTDHGHKKKCGLTGFEPILLGLFVLIRRRKKSRK